MTYTYDFFIDAFTEAGDTAKDLIRKFPEDSLNSRPQPKKWSALEILSHLVQTGSEYSEQLNITFSKDLNNYPLGDEPFRPNWFFRWFIRQVSPENTRPLPTVKSFEPADRDTLNKDQVLQDFLDLQNKVKEMNIKCRDLGLDMDSIYIRNPIVKIVPMSLTATFGLMVAHQKRHFGQIERLDELFRSIS